MIEKVMKNIFIILVIFFCYNVFGQSIGEVTKLKLPRFVSTKSDDINLRVGPSKNYPIILNYTKQNIPLEVIDEHGQWRKIKDLHNHIGWIHKTLLKGNRYGIIATKNLIEFNLYNYPNGQKIGLIKNNNIVEIKRCLKEWCLIQYNSYKAWILKSEIWGVYSSEIYKPNFFQPLIEFYWKINNIKQNVWSNWKRVN